MAEWTSELKQKWDDWFRQENPGEGGLPGYMELRLSGGGHPHGGGFRMWAEPPGLRDSWEFAHEEVAFRMGQYGYLKPTQLAAPQLQPEQQLYQGQPVTQGQPRTQGPTPVVPAAMPGQEPEREYAARPFGDMGITRPRAEQLGRRPTRPAPKPLRLPPISDMREPWQEREPRARREYVRPERMELPKSIPAQQEGRIPQVARDWRAPLREAEPTVAVEGMIPTARPPVMGLAPELTPEQEEKRLNLREILSLPWTHYLKPLFQGLYQMAKIPERGLFVVGEIAEERPIISTALMSGLPGWDLATSSLDLMGFMRDTSTESLKDVVINELQREAGAELPEIEDLRNAWNLGEIGYSLMYDPESRADAWKMLEEGAPMAEIMEKHEHLGIELLGNIIIDPVWLIPPAWMEKALPIGKALGLAAKGFKKLPGIGRLIEVTKAGRAKTYGYAISDAMDTFMGHMPTDESVGVWLGKLLMGDEDALATMGVHDRSLLTQAATTFKRADAQWRAIITKYSSEVIAGMPPDRKATVMAERARAIESLAERIIRRTAPGDLAEMEALLERDPRKIGRWIAEGLINLKRGELGLKPIQARGALYRGMSFAAQLWKETILPLNIAFHQVNLLDSTVRMSLRGYFWDPGDLPVLDRVLHTLTGRQPLEARVTAELTKLGVTLPRELQTGLIRELMDTEAYQLRTRYAMRRVPVPFIGKPRAVMDAFKKLTGNDLVTWAAEASTKGGLRGRIGKLIGAVRFEDASIPIAQAQEMGAGYEYLAKAMNRMNLASLVEAGAENLNIEPLVRITTFWKESEPLFNLSRMGVADLAESFLLERNPGREAIVQEIADQIRNPNVVQSVGDLGSLIQHYIDDVGPKLDAFSLSFRHIRGNKTLEEVATLTRRVGRKPTTEGALDDIFAYGRNLAEENYSRVVSRVAPEQATVEQLRLAGAPDHLPNEILERKASADAAIRRAYKRMGQAVKRIEDVRGSDLSFLDLGRTVSSRVNREVWQPHWNWYYDDFWPTFEAKLDHAKVTGDSFRVSALWAEFREIVPAKFDEVGQKAAQYVDDLTREFLNDIPADELIKALGAEDIARAVPEERIIEPPPIRTPSLEYEVERLGDEVIKTPREGFAWKVRQDADILDDLGDLAAKTTYEAETNTLRQEVIGGRFATEDEVAEVARLVEERGYSARGLLPEDVIVTPDGQFKVIDVGNFERVAEAVGPEVARLPKPIYEPPATLSKDALVEARRIGKTVQEGEELVYLGGSTRIAKTGTALEQGEIVIAKGIDPARGLAFYVELENGEVVGLSLDQLGRLPTPEAALPELPKPAEILRQRGVMPGYGPAEEAPGLVDRILEQESERVIAEDASLLERATALRDDTLEALREMQEQAINKFRASREAAEAVPETLVGLDELKLQAMRQMASGYEGAVTQGIETVHELFYDYAARKGIDELLWWASPFTIWQTRNPFGWAKAIAHRPAIVNVMRRVEAFTEAEREERALPGRFKGTVPISDEITKPLIDKGIIPDGYYAAAVRMFFSIWQQLPILRGELPWGWEDEPLIGKIVRSGEFIGIRVYPWWQIPLEKLGAYGSVPAGDLTYITKYIRATTKAAGYEVDIEGPLREWRDRNDQGGIARYYANLRLLDYYFNEEITMVQLVEAVGNPESPVFAKAFQEAADWHFKVGVVRGLETFTVKNASAAEARGRLLQREYYDQPLNERAAFREENPLLVAYWSVLRSPEQADANRIRQRRNLHLEMARQVSAAAIAKARLGSKGYEEIIDQRRALLDQVRSLYPGYEEIPPLLLSGLRYQASAFFSLNEDFFDEEGELKDEYSWDQYYDAREAFLKELDWEVPGEPNLPGGRLEFERYMAQNETPSEAILNAWERLYGQMVWDVINAGGDITAAKKRANQGRKDTQALIAETLRIHPDWTAEQLFEAKKAAGRIVKWDAWARRNKPLRSALESVLWSGYMGLDDLARKDFREWIRENPDIDPRIATIFEEIILPREVEKAGETWERDMNLVSPKVLLLLGQYLGGLTDLQREGFQAEIEETEKEYELGPAGTGAADVLSFLEAGKASHPDEVGPPEEYDAMIRAVTTGEGIPEAIAIAQSHLDAHRNALGAGRDTVQDSYPGEPEKNEEAVRGFEAVIEALRGAEEPEAQEPPQTLEQAKNIGREWYDKQSPKNQGGLNHDADDYVRRGYLRPEERDDFIWLHGVIRHLMDDLGMPEPEARIYVNRLYPNVITAFIAIDIANEDREWLVQPGEYGFVRGLTRGQAEHAARNTMQLKDERTKEIWRENAESYAKYGYIGPGGVEGYMLHEALEVWLREIMGIGHPHGHEITQRIFYSGSDVDLQTQIEGQPTATPEARGRPPGMAMPVADPGVPSKERGVAPTGLPAMPRPPEEAEARRQAIRERQAGESLRASVLSVYPLSAKGQEYVAGIPMSFKEMEPGFAGWDKERGLEIGSTSLSTLLHELSHGAFAQFNDPQGTDVAAHEFTDEVEAWVKNPEPGYERLVGLFEANIRGGTTWHLGATIPQLVGGNLSLVPPKLRHWFGWLEGGDVKNWDEARQQYEQATVEQRYLLLDALYSNQWGLLGTTIPPKEQPGPGLEPEPPAIEATREAWQSDIAYYEANRDELEARWSQEDPGFWQAYVEKINGQRQILGFADEIEAQARQSREGASPPRPEEAPPSPDEEGRYPGGTFVPSRTPEEESQFDQAKAEMQAWVEGGKEGDWTPLMEQWFGKDTPASEFWEYYYGSIPPGKISQEIRNDPIIAAVLNPETREYWTDEGFKAAQKRLEEWVKKNKGNIPGNPEQWSQIRDFFKLYGMLKDQGRNEEARRLWDRWSNVLQRYGYSRRVERFGRATPAWAKRETGSSLPRLAMRPYQYAAKPWPAPQRRTYA